MENDNYKQGRYELALQETFVETDYMLLSEEGHLKLKDIVIEQRLLHN